MDGTFPEPQSRGGWSGGRPDWDEPVDHCTTFRSTDSNMSLTRAERISKCLRNVTATRSSTLDDTMHINMRSHFYCNSHAVRWSHNAAAIVVY